MMVYGDRSERADPNARLRSLLNDLTRSPEQAPGITRHAKLVEVFIELGRLVQGVADHDFQLTSCDRRTEPTDAMMRLLHSLALTVCRSWDSGFADVDERAFADLAGDLPKEIELKVPEGYAHYALYPEAYAEAARRLVLNGSPRVIGIRSIGTSLAAIVAAAIGAPPPVTVRPVGHPFGRRIDLHPDLAAELLAGNEAHYIIVDEGPGQSGSSFGGVADWLEDHGVPLERIAFLPSHDGDLGPQACDRHRRRWAEAQRQVADFGPCLQQRVGAWVQEELGRTDGDLVEISGGRWRSFLGWPEQNWPAADPMKERRKFLVRSGGAKWLIKFAGLGSTGKRKFDCARTLHAAGLTPEPRALVHGFLIERWHDDARPSPQVRPQQLARYLSARANLLARPGETGAAMHELFAMMRRNIALALGERASRRLDRWSEQLPRLAALSRPVAIDGRLDRHEWLRLPGGRLLKCDAVDHHEAHDLIGCQDIGWDIAGAAIEFELDDGGVEEVVRAVAEVSGRRTDPALLEFLTLGYLAFQLGESWMASEGLSRSHPDRARLRSRAELYAAHISERLGLQTVDLEAARS